MTTQTKAETEARRMAESFTKAGYKVEVTVDRHDAEVISELTTMPGYTVVNVHARSTDMWEPSYSFGFATHDSAPGRRCTTKYVSGIMMRGAGRSRRHHRKSVVKLSLKALRSELSLRLYLATPER
jgi:hypothetical protein